MSEPRPEYNASKYTEQLVTAEEWRMILRMRQLRGATFIVDTDAQCLKVVTSKTEYLGVRAVSSSAGLAVLLKD